MPGVAAAGEGGLLGLAVARDYAQTRWVYAYYTAADDNRIVRFKLGSDDRPRGDLRRASAKAGNHNGGRIAFGPDGMLYVGTGDAARTAAARRTRGSPNGKILRLTPDGDPAPGNPTAGSPVWSLGSPQRAGPGLGRRRHDVRASSSARTGSTRSTSSSRARTTAGPRSRAAATTAGITNPLVTWTTDEASPSGAAIAGDTLYVAALRGERLWTVPLGRRRARGPSSPERYGRLRTVAVAPDGALWLTTSNTDRGPGRDGGDDRILRFPAR